MKKKKYSSNSSNSRYSCKKNYAISKKKMFFLLLITFEKSNITHLTSDVMFSGQRFAILAMFFCGGFFWVNRLCDFFVQRLRDFVCGEVA